MSEVIKNKNYKIIKTTPDSVLFHLHPVSNPILTREVYLTGKHTEQAVPEDWALGVFADAGIYELYRKGLITFDRNEDITKAAFEAGVYFDDQLDFEPAKPETSDEIAKILKSGNHQQITEAITKYGEETVKNIAIVEATNLPVNVVKMLENIFKVQLIMDGGEE